MKPFNLIASIRGSLRPSVYRRMTRTLDITGEEEPTFVLRWSGNVDIDPDALLNLTNDTS